MAYCDRLILTACLIAVAGCGGSGGNAAPGTADDFIGRLLAGFCKLDVACGSAPDLPTCLALQQVDTTDLLTLNADIASGKVHYDKAKAQACLQYFDRYTSTACTRGALAALDVTGNEACGQVFIGTVGEGGVCFSSSECTSTRCRQTTANCSPAHACCPGTCVALPTPIPAGADCSASLPEQDCVKGSYCFTTASSSSATCVIPSQVRGTPCSIIYECASPLFCRVDPGATTGTCQPAAATGAPCISNLGACDDLRDYCDKTTGVCTRLVAVGGACDPAQQNCVYYADCLGSICVSRSPERGACNPTDGPNCLGTLECSATTDTCGFPANAGACM
jgi:hypothetical protein